MRLKKHLLAGAIALLLPALVLAQGGSGGAGGGAGGSGGAGGQGAGGQGGAGQGAGGQGGTGQGQGQNPGQRPGQNQPGQQPPGSGQGANTGQFGSGNNFQASIFPAPLFRQNDISQSMSLTPDQVNRLNQVMTQLQTRFQNDVNGLNNLSADQRARTQMELQQRINNDFFTGARDIFNDQQLNRYRQLQMQFGGFNTFSDPAVQQRLNLTQDQVARLRQEQVWSDQQIQAIMQRAGNDRALANRLYRDYWSQVSTRLNGILTPDQQRVWRTTIGDPFNFQWQFSSSSSSTTPPGRPIDRR